MSHSMTCCHHPQGRTVTLHTPHGPKTTCQACLSSRNDIARLAEALSDIPDYTPEFDLHAPMQI